MILVEVYLKRSEVIELMGSSDDKARVCGRRVEVLSNGYNVTSMLTGHTVFVDNETFHREYEVKL